MTLPSFVIGVDEAGYGPNLGPLVISATVWRLREPGATDLYSELAAAVQDPGAVAGGRDNSSGSGSGSCSGGDGDERLVIADSKVLYRPPQGLARLEANLLAAVRAVHTPAVARWREIWDVLAPGAVGQLAQSPWYHDYDRPAPLAAAPEHVARLGRRFSAALAAAGLELRAVRSRVVFPSEFNELLGKYGSKGELLSRVTLQLIADLLAPIGQQHVLIHCDKHGGRNRYSPLLQDTFPDYLVEIAGEGRAESVYRWGASHCRREIRFTVGGERFMPAALASMASKYLRELAMEAFNAYWRREVSGLKPTAGYPVDARRFRQDVQHAQLRLGISEQMLWRAK